MSFPDRVVLCIEGGVAALERAGYLPIGTPVPAGIYESALEDGVQLTRLPDGRVRLLMSQREAAQRDRAYRRFLEVVLAPIDAGRTRWFGSR